MTILLIIILTVVGVVGDFFLKLASGNPSKYLEWRYFLIGQILFTLTPFGWFFVLKNIKLSSLGIMYSLFTMLSFVIVGVFYFHEQLNVYEIIGILTAVVSLILLSRFS